MKTSVLALAVALSGAAGTAAMAENTATLSYGTFEKNDATTQGLVYEFEGTIAGFGYDGYVFDGDTEGTDTKVAGAKLDWTGVNLYGFGVGPAVAYNYLSVGEESLDGWSGGVAAKGAFGRANVTTNALVSFDDKEYWAVTVDGEMPLTQKTTMLADYAFIKADSEDSQMLALGARYDISATTYVEGQALVERSLDETGAGARIGVGFRF